MIAADLAGKRLERREDQPVWEFTETRFVLTNRGKPAGADFRTVAPALEGVKLNGRWVVMYSKYDIGCALEKHQATDCLGHDHASAVLLGKAAVLYALRR